MPVGELAGLGAGERCKFGQGLGGDGGMDHEQVRRNEHLGDRREILDGVIGQLVIEARTHDQRGIPAHQQGVAVRGRLGGALGRDVAAGAGDVLHHHRLPPGFRELVGEQALR